VDFQFSEREEALRKEIREFAQRELPPDWYCVMYKDEDADEDWALSMSISKKLAERGWLTIGWPKEYGGLGAPMTEQLAYQEEVCYWGVPGITMGAGGVTWVGPSLMLFGNEEQKTKYLPLIASGEPDGVWCTGYSEPGAGSDFASLQTRAVKEGDEYVVNGQKTWTTMAHRSRWCWLAARTDPTARKHRGISMFIVDMRTPGITVSPVISMAGYHSFNEVFFDNVRVPASNLVGEEHQGFFQVMMALSFERTGVAGFIARARRLLDELVQYAKETRHDGKALIKSPLIRQRLADRTVEIEIARVLAYRAALSEGSKSEYEPPIAKVFFDEALERVVNTGMQMLGPYSQVRSGSRWARLRGILEREYVTYHTLKIGAGTDEIQRMIIALRGLDLPRQ
jgi:alkylation response protein AidB-like acyl-CoA dehydrogenase